MDDHSNLPKKKKKKCYNVKDKVQSSIILDPSAYDSFNLTNQMSHAYYI